MKKKDFAAEIQKLSAQELKVKKQTLAQELFKLRLRRASGQLEKTHQIREVRRNIARVDSLLSSATTK